LHDSSSCSFPVMLHVCSLRARLWIRSDAIKICRTTDRGVCSRVSELPIGRDHASHGSPPKTLGLLLRWLAYYSLKRGTNLDPSGVNPPSLSYPQIRYGRFRTDPYGTDQHRGVSVSETWPSSASLPMSWMGIARSSPWLYETRSQPRKFSGGQTWWHLEDFHDREGKEICRERKSWRKSNEADVELVRPRVSCDTSTKSTRKMRGYYSQLTSSRYLILSPSFLPTKSATYNCFKLSMIVDLCS